MRTEQAILQWPLKRLVQAKSNVRKFRRRQLDAHLTLEKDRAKTLFRSQLIHRHTSVFIAASLQRFVEQNFQSAKGPKEGNASAPTGTWQSRGNGSRAVRARSSRSQYLQTRCIACGYIPKGRHKARLFSIMVDILQRCKLLARSGR